MPDERNVHGRMIRLSTGDLINLSLDAIVYYASPDLLLGSGFGGAIAARGGPKIQEELKKLAPLGTTEAVVTSGGNLKSKFIIHAVGPRFEEEDLEGKLKATMENVLRRAAEKNVRSLGFPAMGAGFYGVPLPVCARIMLATIKTFLEQETSLQEITICLRDGREYGPFQKQMKEMQ